LGVEEETLRALILYRSYYGNTRQVAEEIERSLRALGHEAAVQDLRSRLAELAGVDCVFIGAPTRMARVTGRAKAALRKLKARGLGRKPLAVFDTYGPLPKSPEEQAKAERWINPGAAGILAKTASQLGLAVHAQTMRCEVQGLKGPLAEGELGKVAAFVKSFVAAGSPTA
jgi:menaquinone-dependent protoporphyrinogen IX oxidase